MERADPFVVLPAVWLHDCVLVPKNSPERSQASRLAAAKAISLLQAIKYPDEFVPNIAHAIEAHSFSASIECRTFEAEVVQDADRLEVGSVHRNRPLSDDRRFAWSNALENIDEPFPIDRTGDDRTYSIDHFFAKLFTLPSTMKTVSGREAEYPFKS